MTSPFAGYQSNRDTAKAIDAYGIGSLMNCYDRPRLLDIGCNEGQYCLQLADRCSQCVGFEPAPEIIGPAMKIAPANVTFVNEGFKATMLRGERFDVILMLAVLSHLEPPALLARALASALNPDGALVFLSHTLYCDAMTEHKTDRFLLELGRFLTLTRSGLIDCRELESQDKQGKEGLQRRLCAFESGRSLHCGAQRFAFHAAGGTSIVYRRGDRVLKWFEVEQERREIFERIPEIVDQEVAFLKAADPLGIYPRVLDRGARYIVMDYRGEQPSRGNWPADWAAQLETIGEKLVALNRPIGDVDLANVLVDANGRISLIDPIFINGQHDPARRDPDGWFRRMVSLVESDLMQKPDLRLRG